MKLTRDPILKRHHAVDLTPSSATQDLSPSTTQPTTTLALSQLQPTMTPPQPTPPPSTRTPYTPTTPLAHPAAADFVPKFLYAGLPDAQGRPDVRIRDDFYGTQRPMRIGVLGAGISGMQFLRAVRTAPLRDVEVVVYERNEDVGGVVC